MIKAKFCKHNGVYCGFEVSGHANFAEYGQDIVCASVTSAVQLTINGISEILKVDSRIKVLDNSVSIMLPENPNSSTIAFLKALYLHLELLSQDYNGTIKITNVEV